MKDGSAFTTARFAGRVHEVPIDQLRFGLSPRTQDCDPSHVAALSEVLHQVPPVVVHSRSLQVIDGVHRVLAAKSTGQRTIHALMFDGDDVAAEIEAVRSNVAHGKPMTLAEREAAAVRVIQLMPAWSDRRIADVSGLSAKTVARLRRRVDVDPEQSAVRVGSDGRARPVDAAALRRRVADAVEATPDASTRAIARRTGASQATVRDVRDRLRRGLGPCTTPEERRGPAPNGTTPPGQDRQPCVPAGEVAEWFKQRHIDPAEWRRFLAAVPLGHVYELADACRQQSQHWREFAAALEDRARRRRRT